MSPFSALFDSDVTFNFEKPRSNRVKCSIQVAVKSHFVLHPQTLEFIS